MTELSELQMAQLKLLNRQLMNWQMELESIESKVICEYHNQRALRYAGKYIEWIRSEIESLQTRIKYL